MRSSLLNSLSNDNNLQNQLFFFTKFFESHFQKSKNNPVEILTGGCISFVKICNYVKIVITFERHKSIILNKAFQDCYISSFNEGNFNSLLFITSALGASFSSLLRRPSRLLTDGATRRLSYSPLGDFQQLLILLN